MTLDNFIIDGTIPADRGLHHNWDAAHPWIQCFADWTEHTKVYHVRLPEYGNTYGYEWKILADSEYQAQQTALAEWCKLPYEDRYMDEGLDD